MPFYELWVWPLEDLVRKNKNLPTMIFVIVLPVAIIVMESVAYFNMIILR